MLCTVKYLLIAVLYFPLTLVTISVYAKHLSSNILCIWRLISLLGLLLLDLSLQTLYCIKGLIDLFVLHLPALSLYIVLLLLATEVVYVMKLRFLHSTSSGCYCASNENCSFNTSLFGLGGVNCS